MTNDQEILFLPNATAYPPAGWTYVLEAKPGENWKDKEGNECTIYGDGLIDLCVKVATAYFEKGITVDPTKVNSMVQTQICRRSYSNGGGCIKMDGSPVQDVEVSPSPRDYFIGTIAILKNRAKAVLGLDATVPQAEAERRAAICTDCVHNVDLGIFCPSCYAKFLHPDCKTSLDHKLKNCSKCTCLTKVLVHYPVEELNLTDEAKDKLPAHCWKKHLT